MPSAKRLIRLERKASYDYFKDLCDCKRYDEATVFLFAHPEIMNSLSKKELISILNVYREDYMKSIVNMQGISLLEKKTESKNEARGAW